jgi:hypothetical protein
MPWRLLDGELPAAPQQADTLIRGAWMERNHP